MSAINLILSALGQITVGEFLLLVLGGAILIRVWRR